MKRVYGFLVLGLLVVNCNSEPSLQKYFVEHLEDKNFIALDISSSILNVDKAKLSSEQNKALQSFDKMNIIAFRLDDTNKAVFEIERAKVDAILKNKKYQQLMKFGIGKEGASVSFIGSEDHIEEFVLFANKKENGFAVVRVLGKDMNPTHIMNMISVLQTANIDLEQLKPLQEMINN